MHGQLEKFPTLEYGFRLLVVFLLYFAGGRLGLSVPFTSSNVSPVWPAAGIALAAVLVWGYRMWPAIGLAAFLVNFSTSIPPLPALGIAAGNTSAAMVAGFLLRRSVPLDPSLTKLRDVLRLIVFGALFSTTVAATGGVTALFLAHVQPWSGFPSAWTVWWLGDSMGVLIGAPLLLTSRRLVKYFSGPRLFELALLAFGLVIACLAVFDERMGLVVRDDVLAFLVFPFVIWGAIRFRVAGSAVVSSLIATIAIWGTAHGYGPFTKHTPLHNAFLAQLFLAVTSVTGLILAAVMTEREDIGEAFESKDKLLQEIEAAKLALEENQTRLELAQTAARMGVWEWNLETDEVIWSSGAPALYGIEKSVFKIKFNDWLGFVHPRDREAVCKSVEDAVAGNKDHSLEFRTVMPDGSMRWLAGRGKVFRDSSNHPVRMIGICIDVTESKEAEEALRDSQARLAMALQASKTAIFDWDIEQQKGAWTPELAAIYGFKPDAAEITREEWLSLFHPEDAAQLESQAQFASRESDEFQFEFRTVRPNGDTRWIVSRGRMIGDEQGKVIRMLGTHTDITERKEVEEKLRLSQQRLTLAQKAGLSGSFEWDTRTNTNVWSEELLQLYGFRPGEFGGTREAWLDCVVPEDREKVIKVQQESLRAGEFDLDFRIRRKDTGEVRWMHGRAQTFFDRLGKPVRMIGINVDTTDRKLMEEALRQSHAQLESLVLKRTAALQNLSQRLLQLQDEERRRVARDLHDTTGQTLAALKMSLAVLEEQVPQDQRTVALFSEIAALADQALQEIRTTSYLLHPPLLDEAGFSSAAQWYVDGFSRRSGIAVNLDISSQFARFSGSVELTLFRVLQESLTNIHRHSGSSSVNIQLQQVADALILEVKDNGKGIPQQILEGLKQASANMGVGLAGMRERVNELGGGLEVQSNGGGTTIKVSIPVATDSRRFAATVDPDSNISLASD